MVLKNPTHGYFMVLIPMIHELGRITIDSGTGVLDLLLLSQRSGDLKEATESVNCTSYYKYSAIQ